MAAILSLLSDKGLRAKVAAVVFRPGTKLKACEVIKDPYLLLQCPGWTFAQADAVAAACSVPVSERARQLVLHAVKAHLEASGDSLMDSTALKAAIRGVGWDWRQGRNVVGIPMCDRLQAYCDMLEEGSELLLVRRGAVAWQSPLAQERALYAFAQAGLLPAEQHDATQAATSLLGQEYRGPELSLEQAAAVTRAFGPHRLSIITGFPGCGKSACCDAVAQLGRAMGLRIHFMAFTWLAAQRISQLCPGMKATSIHKFVYTVKALRRSGQDLALCKADEQGWFDMDEDTDEEQTLHWPSLDIALVDEASMASTSILHMLTSVLPPRCKLVLVGDEAQLPPIGFGQPFADLVAACRQGQCRAPMTQLTHVFRTKEPHIVEFSAACRAGQLPPWLAPGCSFADFEWLGTQVQDFEGVIAGCDMGQAQVLVAGKRGPVGMWALNAVAALKLRPPAAFVSVVLDQHVMCTSEHLDQRVPLGTLGMVTGLRAGLRVRWRTGVTTDGGDDTGVQPAFVVGDRVIYTDRAHPQVRNGQRGTIVEAEARRPLRVLVDYGSGVRVWHDCSQQGHLQLAYAITIHKFQGNEVPHVVVVVDRSHGMPLMTRNLLYSAITRGKQRVTLMCEGCTLDACLGKQDGRRTCLAELLAGSGCLGTEA